MLTYVMRYVNSVVNLLLGDLQFKYFILYDSMIALTWLQQPVP